MSESPRRSIRSVASARAFVDHRLTAATYPDLIEALDWLEGLATTTIALAVEIHVIRTDAYRLAAEHGGAAAHWSDMERPELVKAADAELDTANDCLVVMRKRSGNDPLANRRARHKLAMSVQHARRRLRCLA